MATTNLARFTINGTPSEDANGKRGYDAGAGEALAITLEANPALGVLTITYDIYDSTKTTSPLNSLYASNLTFTENGAKSYSSSATNSTVHITIPPTADISSYTIRATAVTATGAQIFERLVCVRKNGLRMTIPAESLQYAQRGWSDALNELTKLVADGGVSVSLVSSSATGTVAAFPASQRRIFHSDGVTAGGVWTALAKTDLDSALAAASIDYTKLAPGTEGYVLRTSGGSVVWGADVTLNRPTNPGQNGYVATGLNGDLSYILIGDAQLASNAGITVTKIAPGTSGYVLKTVGTTVQWAEDLCPTLPNSPADDGKVALASGGDLVYGFISNFQVASGANIAVSKLATGTEGYVLMIVGGVPTWAVGGGGGTNLPATPADDGKVAFANAGNLDYADGVKMLNVSGGQNAVSLSGIIMPSTTMPLDPVGSECLLWNSVGNLYWTDVDVTYNVLRSTQPIHTTDDFKVAVAHYGFYEPELLTNNSIASNAAIVVSKFAPSITDNHILRTASGAVSWGFIVDANIAFNANIDISKLSVAAGSDGNYLRIMDGHAVWSAVIYGGDILTSTVNPTALVGGSVNTVLLMGLTSTPVWDTIANPNIKAGAGISVSKIEIGAFRSVLASNSVSNYWTTGPVVDTCSAMYYLDTNGYLWLHQAATEPPNPAAWGCNVYSDIAVLKGKFNNNTVWEIAAQAWSV